MSAHGPIRVLRVIARLNVGGPALHVSYLTSGLDERGYETLLVAGRVGEGEGSMEYAAREVGLAPVIIPELQREIAPLWDARAVRRLVSLIRSFRPHILHTHTAKAGALGRAAALLAGDARPRAIVHTFHGHVLRGYFGPAATAVFLRVERRLARHTDALIAVSPEVKEDLLDFGIAPPERIEVVRLGLDLGSRIQAGDAERAAARAELGVPPDRFLVGWLGRMTDIKRVDALLRAFQMLLGRRVDTELVLVGDGPLRGDLEKLAGRLGVAQRCHFLGFRDDVAPLYAAFDAVALTSANEGTPVIAIEALAACRPVVATRVGGVSDVVADGRTGFLVPPGDLDAVADRLETLAADPELRRRFGQDGRRSVIPRYAVSRLVDDVDALYARLLKEGPVPSSPRRERTAELVPALPELRRARVEPADRGLRIVLVSQYFPPEVGATQTRMQAFAEYLAARGHAVTVICEFPNHPHGVIPGRYRRRLYEDDRSNPYRVLRVWVWTSAQKTQITRVQFYLSYMGLATAVAPLAGRADVVLATSPPLFAGVAGLAIARLSRAPFVLDVRDLWPAAAVSLDQLSSPRAAQVGGALERWLYQQSEAVIAVTQPFCEHIDALRRREPRTILIPNGTLELFFGAAADSGRRELGVPSERFLVTFAGTHGIAQGLHSVLDAAELVDGDVEFAFVGDGPVKAGLKNEAARRAITNVRFHPQVPLEETPPLLAASDALLVTLSSHPTFRTFVPSKMIDYMAVGRPVVLSAAGEAARILDEAGAGIAVKPEDPRALAEALHWLRDHPADAAEMGRRGREYARRFRRSEQAKSLERLLVGLVGKVS